MSIQEILNYHTLKLITMYIGINKNELVILKIEGKIVEKYFSHYEKQNGNGVYFFTTDGVKHHINQFA